MNQFNSRRRFYHDSSYQSHVLIKINERHQHGPIRESHGHR
jgi:hypothetical protein